MRDYEKAYIVYIEKLFGNHDDLSEKNIQERLEKLCEYFGYKKIKLLIQYENDITKMYNDLILDYFNREEYLEML